ncbi:MAG: phosphoribosylpyrophosphate synthetase [Bacteroidetes bacterium]|nr:phosphoribosylpyrophosphate synthetase [Bacteroidota bacterium]
MFTYDTITEAVNGLRKRGYELDFNLEENCLVCHDDRLNIEDFEITELHRFEGDTDPSDQAVVYAVESNDGKKGILVSGYGISAEGMSAEMVKKLHLDRN